ncbi:2-oxopent-4-enoate hydratase [Alteromonas sp. KS69]|jgi:2-oxopent-4-enoate/cis-2-oxohex-4-enoate hydratase|uniref:2-keto-4-pentenoate hydratase 1 n=1 Tax=Paraglaciecola polaris LMG 21857 TaxID=1129793 RepID=K6ZB21_9ALTE|nr:MULTISPECIES: 2-oxopent-4-enoate hydratase [Alteromonadaceae]RUP78445.1 2-oxopent-4-enoate hydratase [Alteromonas sp. KS69]GAC33286.1 2-keto-4-pentenoate hydratase 1 [Paraglaciecola polaris LMG 21857]|tara:strand:+ start:115 stop:900 length:786 start_codon:yes stop_codon:yes gene_type:complete|mmetsp:Transcript_50834/g.162722  ORF Transcript_50834/g.162722 Transcript_50834/m.162722 type:complete len:262 (+) Transcript_50834:220-1005(+)
MNKQQILACGDELYNAILQRKTVKPLTQRFNDISIEDAYHISLRMVERRVQAGAKIIGKKIGVTSKTVQDMLNVHQPDFGYLTDDMAYSQGEEMPISEKLIQPKAEGEIAFILKKDLIGPGITNADVLAATECVIPCFEIVDSRIEDWNIKIQDTVADNASCGLFVLGDKAVSPSKVDLSTCGMVVEKNGQIISTGAGAAALGSPVNCVTWLANTLGQFGIPLKAGEVILSGSLVPLEPVKAGDFMSVSIGGIGNASVRFV